MLDDLGDERGSRNLKEEAPDHIALAVEVAVHLSLRHTAGRINDDQTKRQKLRELLPQRMQSVHRPQSTSQNAQTTLRPNPQ